MSSVLGFALRFLFVLPAIIVHEVSHGWVAYLLGDTTAKDAGRLTANPLKHIDPFGTVLLPLLLLATSGGQFAFGYAKPVPINPNRMGDYRRGMLLTGLAGPTSNLVMAGLAAILVRLSANSANSVVGTVALIAYYFAQINLVLMFFNLIPLPPLDGSRVLPIFLSDDAMRTYARVEQYGFIILLAALWILPEFLHIDPLGTYLRYTVVPVLHFLTGV